MGLFSLFLRKQWLVSIVKDHKDETLMVASIPKSSVADLESLEALTILRGLQLCLYQGISNLIIETNCLLVVEEILQREAPSSAIGNILMDIKELMSHFTDCVIQYGNYMANMVAHKLVRNSWHVNHVAM